MLKIDWYTYNKFQKIFKTKQQPIYHYYYYVFFQVQVLL
jgi:hypothetical protein